MRQFVFLLIICTLFAWAYIVQKGDTLWDLSDEFLQDPFLWTNLWSVNPHIENPHLIYPGDSLCIPGDAPCPKIARGANDNSSNKNNIVKTPKDEYKKKEPPKIFNSYYQRLMPILELATSNNKTGKNDWFLVYNDEANRPIHHYLEHEVLLGFGKKAFPKLQAGDIAEIWNTEKVSIPNASGNFDEHRISRLAALAKITGIGDSLSRAVIVQSFSLLSTEKARSRLQTPIKTIEISSFKQVKQTKVEDMASVLLILDKNIVANLYSYVLINKGEKQKYKPGSAVAFWDLDKRDETLPPKLLGRGLIVHSEDDKATVLIRDIYNASNRIDAGTPVSITHQPVLE